MSRSLKRSAACVAVSAALLAGCGTTVDTARVSGSSGDVLATAPPQAALAGTDGSISSAPQVGVTSASRTNASLLASSTTATGTTPALGPAAGPAGGALTGRGFTATTIEIGIATADDYNAFAGALGVKGVTATGDPAVQMNAVVADVNKHGGILGRKVVVVAHDFNTAQVLSDPATANQAACADWTQDHHVFAVLEPAIVEDTLLSCLAKTATPVIYAGGIESPVHYSEVYAKYPLYFNIAQMVGERFDRIAIGRLAARGFFGPWDTLAGKPGNASSNPVKVGVVAADDHDGDLELASEVRQLARHGIKPADVIRCPRSIQDAVACQQSSVLKLHQDGITHILGVGYPFMVNADKQQYHPRYFVKVEPRVYAENAPASQLVGSMGEGYIPSMDVETTEYPGDPTAATGYCRKVMRAAGEGTDDPTTLWGELIDCDVVYFLRAAVQTAGALGPQALRVGFEGLGSREPSALTWGTSFSATSHTSATVLRDIEFRPSTGRYAYVGTASYGG